jgi:NAD(P)-dependent dehydrogenase (short-subunit alcohol dehydrogenase family)
MCMNWSTEVYYLLRVTGAASGIGKACARVSGAPRAHRISRRAADGRVSPLLFKAFAAAGSKLVLIDRDLAGLQTLEEELSLPQGHVLIECVDVSDLPSLGRFIRTIPERMGGLHFSIHCAGILGPDYDTPLHELSESRWDLVYFTTVLWSQDGH